MVVMKISLILVLLLLAFPSESSTVLTKELNLSTYINMGLLYGFRLDIESTPSKVWLEFDSEKHIFTAQDVDLRVSSNILLDETVPYDLMLISSKSLCRSLIDGQIKFVDVVGTKLNDKIMDEGVSYTGLDFEHDDEHFFSDNKLTIFGTKKISQTMLQCSGELFIQASVRL